MTEERKVEIRSWGISIFIHVILLAVLGATGLLAISKNDDTKDLADVVWIENAGGGNSGSSGSGAVAEVSGVEAQIETPILIPQKDVREKNNETSDKITSTSKVNNSPARPNTVSSAGSSGTENKGDSAQGVGNGSGNGDGSSTGNGEGFGEGNGTGENIGDGEGVGGMGSSPTERAEAVCTYKASPKYPARMREQGIGGRVVLEICVNPSDMIESVEVISSSGYGALDEAAINAAYRCQFSMNGLWGRYTLSYAFEMVDDDW